MHKFCTQAAQVHVLECCAKIRKQIYLSTAGIGLNTVKEHQEFLTKMEISLISNKSFTMEVYGDFILNDAVSTGNLTKVILAIQIVY